MWNLTRQKRKNKKKRSSVLVGEKMERSLSAALLAGVISSKTRLVWACTSWCVNSCKDTKYSGQMLHYKYVLKTKRKAGRLTWETSACVDLVFRVWLLASSPPHPGSLNLPSCKRLDPPVFIEPLQDCCVDEGSDITLRGVVTGSQPIRVWWLHNGEQGQFTLLDKCDPQYSKAQKDSLKANIA